MSVFWTCNISTDVVHKNFTNIPSFLAMKIFVRVYDTEGVLRPFLSPNMGHTTLWNPKRRCLFSTAVAVKLITRNLKTILLCCGRTLEPPVGLLAFSQVHPSLRCRGRGEALSSQGVACLRPFALCILGLNVIRKAGRCCRVSGFFFLLEIPRRNHERRGLVWIRLDENTNTDGRSLCSGLRRCFMPVYMCANMGEGAPNQRGFSVNLELSLWPLTTDSQLRNALCVSVSCRKDEESTVVQLTQKCNLLYLKSPVFLFV